MTNTQQAHPLGARGSLFRAGGRGGGGALTWEQGRACVCMGGGTLVVAGVGV